MQSEEGGDGSSLWKCGERVVSGHPTSSGTTNTMHGAKDNVAAVAGESRTENARKMVEYVWISGPPAGPAAAALATPQSRIGLLFAALDKLLCLSQAEDGPPPHRRSRSQSEEDEDDDAITTEARPRPSSASSSFALSDSSSFGLSSDAEHPTPASCPAALRSSPTFPFQ